MIFLIIVITLVKLSNGYTSNVGSALFYRRSVTNECWDDRDIAKLKARRVFEELIPPPISPDKINGKYIRDLTNYFNRALRLTEKENPYNASLLKDALTDTIGGHFRAEILPAVRFAYYAGYIPHKYAVQAHEYFDQMKAQLNTLGLGWNPPNGSLPLDSLIVSKLIIKPSGYDDPCSFLVLKRDKDNCIHLPKPKIDDSRDPAAIALPFKNGGLISLSSPKSESIIIHYYTTASKCLLQRSTNSCRHSDFINFNNEIWHWMKNDVSAHLMDEKLYSAYGGILRVAAAVQGYGRGLKRRNLFDSNEVGARDMNILAKAHARAQSEGWGAKMYILVVALAAVCVYVTQLCCTVIANESCRGADKPSNAQEPKVFAYTDVESNFPAMLPAPASPDARSGTDRSEHARSRSRTRTRTRTSVGSVRTECVYDLNENQEKLMDVIMSADVSSGSASSSSSGSRGSSEEEEAGSRGSSEEEEAGATLRANSPAAPPRRPSARAPVSHTSSWTESGSSTSGGSWHERGWTHGRGRRPALRTHTGSASAPTSDSQKA